MKWNRVKVAEWRVDRRRGHETNELNARFGE